MPDTVEAQRERQFNEWAFEAMLNEQRKKYADMAVSDMVMDVLREQPRNLEMIGWGIYQIFGYQMDVWELLHYLAALERDGKAVQCQTGMKGMPTGIWWRLPF